MYVLWVDKSIYKISYRQEQKGRLLPKSQINR